MCDAIKKMNRIRDGLVSTNQPRSMELAVADVANEIGDNFMYLELLAQRLGLKMEDCVRNAFNRMSIRENLPQRL